MKITMEDFQSALGDYSGFCTSCDTFTTSEVEPDASGYECDICEKKIVCGAEDALFFGYVRIIEGGK
jgi:hypothetical protein